MAALGVSGENIPNERATENSMKRLIRVRTGFICLCARVRVKLPLVIEVQLETSPPAATLGTGLH